MTRLRTSSHPFPIETLRYCKPKIEACDRKCNICDKGKIGDEIHYLTDCDNDSLLTIRNNFMTNIIQTIPEFEQFDLNNIIQYCLLMHDHRIFSPMTDYVKALMIAYREETAVKKAELPTITRCGRLIKKPNRLDL